MNHIIRNHAFAYMTPIDTDHPHALRLDPDAIEQGQRSRLTPSLLATGKSYPNYLGGC